MPEIASNPISLMSELEGAAAGDMLPILDVSDVSEIGTGKVKKIAYANLVKNTPRVTEEVSSATPSIDVDQCDIHKLTALAANITNMSSGLSGTPSDGQKLILMIKDDGSSKTINWGTAFLATLQASLVGATVAGKQMIMGFIYDAGLAVWRCVAVAWDA